MQWSFGTLPSCRIWPLLIRPLIRCLIGWRHLADTVKEAYSSPRLHLKTTSLALWSNSIVRIVFYHISS